MHEPWFVVPSTGVYYLGWHSTSAANQGGVALDDIFIYERGACEAPTDVFVHEGPFPTPGYVTLGVETYGGWGVGLQYQWYTGPDCNPANAIVGATSDTLTTTVSGIYACKAYYYNPETCFGCDSIVVNVLPPVAGDECTSALPLTTPVYGTPTVVSGDVGLFYPTCTVTCGESISDGPDLFYAMTLSGDCRRITMILTGSGEEWDDPFLALYSSPSNCCGSPLYCNDNDPDFAPLPPWDSLALHTLTPNSYISAELDPGTYYIRIGVSQGASGNFTLSVHDLGPCWEPCDPAEALTVYVNPSNPSQVWLHFNALNPGTYNIYSTMTRNNDGNPDNGADPQWSLDTTIIVETAGVVAWVDTRAIETYRNYSVVHQCVPVLGRCCYGNPELPSCSDNERAECLALGGTWNHYYRCETNPCVISGTGETCETAILVASYPYTVTNASTAGFGSDYQRSVACLPSYSWEYTSYQDVIYKIVLSTSTDLRFTYTQPGWSSLTVYDACPATGNCIVGLQSPSVGTLVSSCISFAPGTYYVMIDSWTTLPITYSMTIETCTP
jgi:hypothetical protein